MAGNNGQTGYRRSVQRDQASRSQSRPQPRASRSQAAQPQSRASRSDRTTRNAAANRPGSLVILIIAIVILSIVIGLIIHSCATSGNAAAPAPSGQPASQQASAGASSYKDADSSLRHGSFGDRKDFAIWRSEAERSATSTSTNEQTPGRHVAFLTFDDGPSQNTPRILDILDRYEIKATWFVKGDVEAIGYCKDIWERGHQVAIHTYSHDYNEVYASADAFWADMDRAGRAINEQIGFTPTLIRFPGGSINSYNGDIAATLASQVHARGWHYFDWNVSIGDSTQDRSVSGLVENIRREADGNNSSCVLMHDDGAKIETVEALEQVIQYFIGEGYEFDVITADTFGYHF